MSASEIGRQYRTQAFAPQTRKRRTKFPGKDHRAGKVAGGASQQAKRSHRR
jgi:hypothetical protein